VCVSVWTHTPLPFPVACISVQMRGRCCLTILSTLHERRSMYVILLFMLPSPPVHVIAWYPYLYRVHYCALFVLIAFLSGANRLCNLVVHVCDCMRLFVLMALSRFQSSEGKKE
jgi:hypothetical protein